MALNSKKFIKSRIHLKYISEQPCILCGKVEVQSAHIRFAGAGIGLKPSDSFVVPLCLDHHREQHTMNEKFFWELYKKNPIAYAMFFCLCSPDQKIKKNAYSQFEKFFGQDSFINS